MATVEKRQQTAGGAITWRCRWRDPDGSDRSKTFPTKREAVAHGIAMESDKRTHTYVDPKGAKRTLAEFYETDVLPGRVHKPGTARRWRMVWNKHVGPTFGHRRIGSIRQSEVQRWVGSLGHLKPGTVSGIYGNLSAILQVAVDDKLISENPCAGVNLRPDESGELIPPTTAEVLGLFDSADPQWRAFVMVGAGLGLRSGEARGLSLRQVDFLRRTVRIDQQVVDIDGAYELAPVKTGAGNRTIPLPAVVANALAAHVAQYPPGPDGLIFTVARGKRKGLPRAGKSVVHFMDSATGGSFTYHALRHYYASLLIQAGESVKVVQKRLGHRSAQLTLDTYGHMWPDDEDTTRNAVDGVLDVSADEAEVSGIRPDEDDGKAGGLVAV